MYATCITTDTISTHLNTRHFNTPPHTPFQHAPHKHPPQHTATLDPPTLHIHTSQHRGTVLLGFEQANKYTIYNQHGDVVALLAEDDSITRTVGRQILSNHRPINATVLSPDGQHILFRIKRPAYVFSSCAHIVDEDGAPLGDVFGRWHPLRRNYDLYVDRRQVAAIRGDFLAWQFEVTDDKGGVLALIDRNFQV